MPEQPNWGTSAISSRMMIRVAGLSRPTPQASSLVSSTKVMAGAVRRSRHEPMRGGSASPVSRSHSNGRKNPAAVEEKPGIEPLLHLQGRRETLQGRNEMNAAPFETIPAWRIARLRAALRDADQRGANPNDEGHDLTHRALQRRFALARGRAKHAPRLGSRPKSTRKGRSFPHLKLVIIWRAILSCRSSAWKQGDTAPFGSIRRAHDQAVAACRAAGLTPPRYRTVYVLWHRGVPPADVVAALRTEYTNPTG
jgi:hypothetical protein